ncbi:restriction endonuclease subunit S [Alteromonas australica]|uniref:restriction endonuclease subunit S n=1 Tax=Alteromonas australica TaxID=589873 RepID=UPI0035C84681
MQLANVVTIKNGRTFATGIKAHPEPTHKVVQLRDVDERSIDWDRLVDIRIETNRKVGTLEQDQILIVAKGPEKSAVYIDEPAFNNVVATQHFLVLTVNDKETLLPKFLYHYLSSGPIQAWLNGNAGGSYQSSLSKTSLSKLPFPSLSIEQQSLVLEGVESVETEVQLYATLIRARKQQLDQIFSELLKR